MARKSGSRPSAMKTRAAKSAQALSTPAVAGGGASAAAVADAPPRRKTSPQQFFKEVRAEAKKITWTTRKETWITSVMVFIMVALTAIFLRVVDMGLGFTVDQLLKLAIRG